MVVSCKSFPSYFCHQKDLVGVSYAAKTSEITRSE